MIERLANVIYWAACGIAALIGLIGLWVVATESNSRFASFGICAAAAFLFWLGGRAVRYVLAGR